MAQTLETLIAKEHEAITKEREDLLTQKAEIEEKLAALDRRLKAAENYKLTLEGKLPQFTQTTPRAPRTAPRAPRGERGELRTRIKEIVGSFPNGATSEAITTELQISDKAGKQKVANLLVLMKKDGELSQSAKRQPYTLTPSLV